ncbi:non-ribosomal peptide synthetase [Vibrio mangrovi]|uniref:Linear gramicidin synthase subunit D n=1 Tax=Vibrio mangrovi TaxID=474394 RepID=A0A1Y6IQL4_9VIBR|nr:non-ribosomal peptide synthetase [Vibrio mangrovi]MDW6003285.1 non-ribosomal peptide synthetase [Vibrio mangrovi]SMR99926.1 Linear gramicidin synthase subunit D [Vibrio mangrovi]
MSIAVLLAELFQHDIHLRLADGKLKIDAPKGALTAEVKQTLQARKAEIMAYLESQNQSVGLPSLSRVDRAARYFPLSFAQERMWFLQQFEQESGQYNVNALLSLHGDVSLELFQQVFAHLISEQEIFRTTFQAGEDGRPVAGLLDAADVIRRLQIREVDLSGVSQSGEHEPAYDSALQAAMSEPFDLAHPPLFRLTHLKLSSGESRLLLTFHHIIIDHWSLQNLTRMMVQTANQMSIRSDSGELATDPQETRFQYIDYAQWQKQLLSDNTYDNLLAYWRGTLEDGNYSLDLPMRQSVGEDRAGLSDAGARYHFTLEGAVYHQLKQVCESYRVTPYTVLLAAYQWMLSQRTGQRDIRVATPVAERSLPEFENMLGLFVNTLVIRTQYSSESSAESWLQSVHQAVSGAQSHSAMPFEKLVDELVSSRDMAHEPLVQTMFNYLDESSSGEITLGDMQIRALPVPEFTSKYDLSLFAVHHAQHLALSFQYRTACYDAGQVALLACYYQTALTRLLDALLREPARLLKSFPVLSDDEWQTLQDWNQTGLAALLPPELKHQTLGEALEAQALQTPLQQALVFAQHDKNSRNNEEVRWDYQTLNRQVNQLANWLVNQGVDTESRIAVCMPRGVQMVVSLLAIVKAGCAYVPVDPEHPSQRLTHIVEQAQPALLLTVPELADLAAEFCGAMPCHLLDDSFSLTAGEATTCPDLSKCGAENLAYILFTSGSTGKPKGVAVPHVGVMNRILWMQNEYPLDASDVVLQKTPYSFDVSVWEFFWPLMVGATLVVAQPGDHKDSQKLVDLIRHHRVTTMHFVPTMLQAFLEHHDVASCTSLRRVFTSGEALSFALQERFFSHFSCQLHNLYGPTEASIDVTYWDCSKPCPGVVPIGYPIANMQTWILNEDLNPVPVGVPGELYLSGPGLARGYFGRDDLTAQAFITNPLPLNENPNSDNHWYARLYRTGDLARYRNDGSIEYLGRTDFQVKVRGLRIELGEIEAALLDLNFVKEAIVTAPDSQTLAAYVVLDGDEPDWNQWQALLASRLPAYMIPSVFMRLERMPVNANGKADRKALPAINLACQNAGEYVAPQTRNETLLAQVFAGVLRLEQVSIEDNFFALGGDSIMSLQVVAKARELGLAIEPKEVFKHATVKALASVARAGEQTVFSGGESYGKTRPGAIQHWFLNQNLPNPDQFNQAVLLSGTAPVNPVLLEQTLLRLLQMHPLLCARFTQEASGSDWILAVPSPDEIMPERLALRSLEWNVEAGENLQPQIDELCRQEQSALSLSEGKLFRATCVRINRFQSNKEPSAAAEYRLLLVAHHLVIDAVSWRILLDALSRDYERLSAGQTLEPIRAMTLPYKGWVERCRKRFGLPEGDVRKSLDIWQQWAAQPDVQQALQVSYPLAEQPLFPRQPIGIAAMERFELSQETTHTLLQHIAPRMKANAEEICLTALAHALSEWSGQPHHLIQLEGHGRDQLDADVSQTLGWFTRIYPALISAGSHGRVQSWADALLHNRSVLSGNPERQSAQSAQSALPFLQLQSQLPESLEVQEHDLLHKSNQPSLVFNYLGQLDLTSEDGHGSALFRKAPEQLSAFRDEQNPRYWPIEVNAFVQNGQLVVNVQYAAQWLSQTQAQKLAEYFSRSLTSLAGAGPMATGAIAADYPLAKVSDAQLLTLIRTAEQHGVEIEDIYTLSPAQQGMYFYCLDHPDAYISQSLVTCRGRFHMEAFRRAWENAVSRHSALRTRFICDGVDEPHQIVQKQASLIFREYDWSQLTEAECQQQMNVLQTEECQQLNPEQAPLMRLALIRLSDTTDGQGNYRLVWTIHHLIMDGWCLQRLVGEVMADYRKLVQGTAISGSPVSCYRDFIAWLGEHHQEAKAEAYWKDTLSGFQEANPLPKGATGLPQEPQTTTFYSQSLGESLTAQLAGWARTQGVTLNTAIQGLWGLVLSRYMATGDVVYGVTTSGRPADLANADAIMGVFINTLPLRVKIDAEALLGEWLTALQDQNLQMRDYEQTPLAKIQRWSDIPGNGALFNSLLVFENLPVADSAPIEGLSLTLDDHHVENNFPLTLRVVPRQNLQFDLLMDPQQVDVTLMTGIVRGLIRCIELVTSEPLSLHLPLRQLLNRWAGYEQQTIRLPAPAERHALQRMSAQNGETTALEFYPQGAPLTRWSYSALLSQAGKLAQQLPEVHRDRISAGQPVIAICMPRQMEQILAMLAVWYKGAAWVCIDPELPLARVEAIVADARPAYFIGGEKPDWAAAQGADLLKECNWVDISGLIDPAAEATGQPVFPDLNPEDTAYLVYTSGSTGQPKGVQVTHRNLLSYVDALFDRVSLGPKVSMTTFSTVAADLGFTCVLGALCSGRALRLLPPGYYFDPEALAETLAQQPVDVLKIAPSHLKALLAVAQPERLLPKTCLIVGGESLDAALLAQLRSLAPAMRIVNHYGPTETTIGCTATQIHSADDLGSIGTPLANNLAYVVDDSGLVVADGIAGELWIAGLGVAKGYLNKPQETARQFSQTGDFGLTGASASLPLYKTGDRVARGSQGELIYLGRQDDQVKIRGFRVELAEVTATLKAMDEVQDAVVLAVDGPSGKRLAAAVILTGEIPAAGVASEPRTLKHLEVSMEEKLPDYMVPRLWQALERFPLQKNGKLDRQMLAASLTEPAVTQSVSEQQQSVLEQQQPESSRKSAQMTPATDVLLSDLWQSLLNVRPQPDDNLFALGADSIVCLQFIAKARQHGFKFTPKQIYAAPTVAELARLSGDSVTDGVKTVPIAATESSHDVVQNHPAVSNGADSQPTADQPEPERSVTEVLQQLWSALLQQDVDVSDNFFTLGGDSIIALQLVARARQHGLVITPKMLYATPTIAELAISLGELESPSEAVMTADPAKRHTEQANSVQMHDQSQDREQRFPLLPIQKWFFEQPQPYPHYWNQAVMLQLPEQIDHQRMSQAVEVLLVKHPLLTARFEHMDDPSRASYWLSHETAAVYAGFDGQDENGAAALVAATQQSLNLTAGPLFKVVALNMADGEPRLLLVAHHLVVDGVSWRVIGRDLHQAYQALCAGDSVSSGAEITTAQQWQQALVDFPDDKLATARNYWQPMVGQFDAGLLIPGAQPGTVGEVYSHRQTFSANLTERLIGLGSLHQRSACEVAMVSALVRAVSMQFPRQQLLIEMESHGRSPWQETQDLSETVGWLTSRFPVRLTCDAETLESVAWQLADVPDLGIGYGVLRYLSQSLAFPAPQVLFNYLGQTGSLDADWKPVQGAGQARHPHSIRRQLIEVTAQIRDGVLEVVWQYPPSLKPQLEPVVDAFHEQMNHLASLPELSVAETRSSPAATAGQSAIDYPLTPVQQGMYLHSAASAGTMYFNQTAVAVYGDLQAGAFLQAWQETVNAEQALRAQFGENQQGEPRQCFAPQVILPVEQLDWSGCDESQLQRRLEELCLNDRRKGFDLNVPPLMRLYLIRVSGQQHWLVWSRHHLIVDAWCSALVIQDVMTRYRQAMGDRSVQLAPRPDFSTYLDWLEQQDLDASKAFWKSYLSGFDTPVALPGGEPDGRFELFDHCLSEEQTAAVKALCRTYGVTLNTVMQVAWGLTLAHHSGQKDIVFGMTTSGRPADLPQAQRIVGIFINTLAVRLPLQPDQTLAQLLTTTHRQGVELREHECLPLVDITAQSELVHRGQSLFDSLMVFENEALGESSGQENRHGLSVTPLQAYERNNYPLTLTIMPHESLVLRVACDGERVSALAARHMLATLEQILSAFTMAQGDEHLKDLCWQACPAEAHFCGEAAETGSWHLGSGLLSDWELKKDRVAVAAQDGQLTYAELLERTLCLAHVLRKRGINKQSRAVVCHSRQTDMLVALLAVYGSGASYIPLDPSQPQERLQLILEETQPELILTDGQIVIGDAALNQPVAALIRGITLSDADYAYELEWLRHQDSGLAYTIFTSGSTGRPKGVQIARPALSNFLHSMLTATRITAADKLLAVTTVGFDIAVLELFVPLLAGAQVVIADEMMVRDGEALSRCLQQQHISVMQGTPMTWQMLTEQEHRDWHHLTALVGGEALPPTLAGSILNRGARLLNMYGPTETTVWSSYSEITAENMHRPPLGQPIANTQFYVLDPWLNPVAPGAEGELYIGGAGISEGYLNRMDLTEAAFLPDPFTSRDGAKMYKTGDKVRLSIHGELHYIGRTDFQIKLRGYRIETGEIEAQLCMIPGIREAAVSLCYAGTPKACLVAYITTDVTADISGTESGTEQVKSRLGQVLPAYMVPQHIVCLEAMPRNANNKVDRKALPEPAGIADEATARTEPCTATEQAVATIWQTLLGTEKVYREDDFFALGGNSLLAGRLIAMLRRQWAIELPLMQVFRHPVLRTLAQLVDSEQDQTESGNDPDLQDLLVPMNARAQENLHTRTACDNVFLMHPAGGIVRAYQEMVKTFADRFPVYGIESPQLHGSASELSPLAPTSIEQLCAHYVQLIRAVQPHGPYRLAGWSFGAWLAMAVTHQLEADGERVEWVTIIDARANAHKARLQVPELNRVSRYLACLNHRHRTLLLENRQTELSELEQDLARLSPQEQLNIDQYAFDALVQLIGETEVIFDGEGDRALRFIQMQLFMSSHRLMQEHTLRPVAAPLMVFWSNQTLSGSRYQQGASPDEWDVYGQVQRQTLPGDHESIVRDTRVAEQILESMHFSGEVLDG